MWTRLSLVALAAAIALATTPIADAQSVSSIQSSSPEFYSTSSSSSIRKLAEDNGHGHGGDDEEGEDSHVGHGHDDDDGHEGHGHDDDEEDDSHDHALESSQEDKPWGSVILAALLINMVTLIGLAALSGQFCMKQLSAAPRQKSTWKFTSNIIPSFATGALLATCAFLMFPESFFMISNHLLEQQGVDPHAGHDHRGRYLAGEDDDDEHAGEIDTPVAWRFGLSLLGGFLLPVVSSLLFPRYEEPDHCEVCAAQRRRESFAVLRSRHALPSPAMLTIAKGNSKKLEEDENVVVFSKGDISEEEEAAATAPTEITPPATETEVSADEVDDKGVHTDEELGDPKTDEEIQMMVEEEERLNKKIDWPLVASISFGDIFHNFTDGVLVGTAFKLCNRDLAITISVATVYHELAQELADYFMLTKHCGLRPAGALFINFVAGLSVLVGALLIFAVDISSMATGCILAIGGGVYIYVAAGECMPRALKTHQSKFDKIVSLFSFCLGVLPIGLVLLNHGHC